MSDHWVYIFYARETNRIKIGRSSTDHGCDERLKSCQTGSPEQLYMVAKLPPGTHPGEKALHAELKDVRSHGEWFSAESHVITRLEAHVPVHLIEWPAFYIPNQATPNGRDCHYIKSENVYVDREPFEVEFGSRFGHHRRRGYLYVGYGINYEAISDDYDPVYDSAWAVYDRWRHWARQKHSEPPGVAIYWYVAGCGTFDDHPTAFDHFHDISHGEHKWNRFHQTPYRADGKPFNWSDLPIEIKRWHKDYPVGKGGFIEEYTGFKPSPLQSHVTLDHLERLCK